MGPERSFQLIEAAEPEVYPEELIGARMSSDYFIMLHHDRYLNSTLHLKASYEVQGVALVLFMIARKQNPVGSLPEDDEILAKLLRMDLASWLEMRGRSINPLRGWRRMRAGDSFVLGHPVVIEVTLDALHKREQRTLANGEKAVYARRARLRQVLADIGCCKGLIEDDVLVGRLDDWLTENHRGRRQMPEFENSVKRALAHASAARWIEPEQVKQLK